MDANRALAKRLEKLEAEVAELKAPPRQSLFKKPAARAPGPAQAVVAAAAADAFDRSLAPLPPPAPPKPPSPPGIAGYAVVYFLVPVAMLLAGHYLIVMKFDLNPLYL
ncbi:MAG: hypothetical protein FJX46_14165, partial [Alphaproteobacteria bacterium]|nr:hypothetical protein [Alphaproteobacteria bacterium]